MKPDFNRDSGEGQLLPQERELLYKTVCEIRPQTSIEVGTWKGGGSTYIIACALHENGGGDLYTIEADQENYEHALDLYSVGDLRNLGAFVHLIKGDGTYRLSGLMAEYSPTFVFLDGSDDPWVTFLLYDTVTQRMAAGGVISFHDWDGIKTAEVRKVIDNSPHWSKTGHAGNLTTYVRTEH